MYDGERWARKATLRLRAPVDRYDGHERDFSRRGDRTLVPAFTRSILESRWRNTRVLVRIAARATRRDAAERRCAPIAFSIARQFCARARAIRSFVSPANANATKTKPRNLDRKRNISSRARTISPLGNRLVSPLSSFPLPSPRPPLPLDFAHANACAATHAVHKRARARRSRRFPRRERGEREK